MESAESSIAGEVKKIPSNFQMFEYEAKKDQVIEIGASKFKFPSNGKFMVRIPNDPGTIVKVYHPTTDGSEPKALEFTFEQFRTMATPLNRKQRREMQMRRK